MKKIQSNEKVIVHLHLGEQSGHVQGLGIERILGVCGESDNSSFGKVVLELIRRSGGLQPFLKRVQLIEAKEFGT